ncbi:MAG: helix-turn-helix domain-containing protein [Bryobacter sp.]|jgi:transcriptional regulator with XRE-family HTH domain|nr:helix-turn-helix domain-containing protein [Bryobacter sp. CoA8 C33]
MKTQHEVLMEDPEFRRLLAIEALVAEASELIARLMAEQNVSKADLARRLNRSRSWVTQLLSGKANLTIRTLAEVVHALDSEVKLQAQPPRLKGPGKPAATGWQPVVFKMDKLRLESPVVSQDLFWLQTNKMTTTKDDLALVTRDDDPTRSEYAA